MIGWSLWEELTENYGDYPTSGLLFIGGGGVAITLLIALTLSLNSRLPHDEFVHSGKE